MASDLDEAAGAELDAIGGLGSLLDKSLILQTESTDGDRTPRVAMLETIKAYATKALDAQPTFAAAAREHHAAYFAQLAADAATTEGDQSNDRLAPELDNLAIAWRQCVATHDLARLTPLRDGLWPIYERRGWYHALLDAHRRPHRRPGDDAGEPGPLGAGGQAPLEPRTGDHAPARLRQRRRGRVRGRAGARQGPRRGAAVVPDPPEPGQLPRVPRRVRQGDPLRERDPAPRRCRGRREHAGLRLRDARRGHGVQPGEWTRRSGTSTRRSRASRAATTDRDATGSGSTPGSRA